MRRGLACLLGLASIALTSALSLEKRDNPAVLTVPMARETSRQMSKRSKSVDVDLDNEKVDYTSYVANMTFGTPPQQFHAYFDLWGNGCWLESVDDSDCSLWTNHSSCGGYGGYNMSASTTAKKLDENFAYDDFGSMTKGDFVADVLKIGGVKVDAMKMGVITDTMITANTLSLGYGNTSSISLIQSLADAGAINTPAFSLYHQTALFGGVNKAKYYDDLHTFPIVNGSGLTKALRINMTGISINGTSAAAAEFPLDTFFDIVTPMTYVPKSVAQALNAQIGNTSLPDEDGQVNFSCSAVGENSTIEFKFGSLELQFWLSDFVSREEGQVPSPYGYDPSQETCYFTIYENIDLQEKGSIVLGSSFISKIYAVFDLENDEVSLAELRFEPAADDIVEITSGKDGVPGAKKESADKDSAGTRIETGLLVSALVVGLAILNLIL